MIFQSMIIAELQMEKARKKRYGIVQGVNMRKPEAIASGFVIALAKELQVREWAEFATIGIFSVRCASK
jgi:hypothetical protein